MVAYSFKPRFRAPILAGTKRQTIRAERKRHARPGEQVQLYTGMRTRQCAIIGTATCIRVAPIQIGVEDGWIDVKYIRSSSAAALDEFARADGFADWAEMRAFWRAEHPTAAVFSGALIVWDRFVAGVA